MQRLSFSSSSGSNHHRHSLTVDFSNLKYNPLLKIKSKYLKNYSNIDEHTYQLYLPNTPEYIIYMDAK